MKGEREREREGGERGRGGERPNRHKGRQNRQAHSHTDICRSKA